MTRFLLLAITILLAPGALPALRAGDPAPALPDLDAMKAALVGDGLDADSSRGVGVTKNPEIAVQLQFAYNSTDLAFPEQKRWVEQTAAKVLLDPAFARFTFSIEGHTDSRGSSLYNLDLSERRAIAIRNILIAKGVPPERLTAVGRGEDFPIADGDTEEDYQKNRRVVFIRQ